MATDPSYPEHRSTTSAPYASSRRTPGFGYQSSTTVGGMDERVARGLGWFSIGLGLWGFASPRGMARAIGVPQDDTNTTILRAVGAREIAQGIGILTQPRPTGWLWSRVVGDVMDLSYLGWTLLSGGAREPSRTVLAMASVLGITPADLMCSVDMSKTDAPTRAERQRAAGMRVRKAFTIRRPVEELYQFWRDFQNLPRIMSNLESVQVTGDRRSHWRAKGPAGTTVEWEAEIVDDRPNEMIAWRSLPGAEIPNAGAVLFRQAPGRRGAEVMVDLQFDAPGGRFGRTIARLFGKDPAQEIETDLRRFKQLMETGEVVVSEATLGARGLLQRPAQPPESTEQRARAA